MRPSALIVDDEFGLAELVAELLGEAGYDAAIATNGQVGLQALAEKRPDVVVCDVMMPILDGPRMVRQMKANPVYASIPVVMVTALRESLPKDAPPLYDAFLQKPFSIEDLLATVKRLITSSPGRLK